MVGVFTTPPSCTCQAPAPRAWPACRPAFAPVAPAHKGPTLTTLTILNVFVVPTSVPYPPGSSVPHRHQSPRQPKGQTALGKASQVRERGAGSAEGGEGWVGNEKACAAALPFPIPPCPSHTRLALTHALRPLCNTPSRQAEPPGAQATAAVDLPNAGHGDCDSVSRVASGGRVSLRAPRHARLLVAKRLPLPYVARTWCLLSLTVLADAGAVRIVSLPNKLPKCG